MLVAGQVTSPDPEAVDAMVTIPSHAVHVEVRVMFAPSTSFTLHPDAERVTVWDVASLEFAMVWSQVFVPLEVPENVPDCVARLPSPILARAIPAFNPERFSIFNIYPPLKNVCQVPSSRRYLVPEFSSLGKNP